MLNQACLHLLALEGVCTPGVDGFFDHVPDGPDEIVVVTGLGGPADRAVPGEADGGLQVRIRGASDGSVLGAQTRAFDVYRALRDVKSTTWGTGDTAVRVVDATARTPAWMGRDSQGRPEYVVRVEARHTGA